MARCKIGERKLKKLSRAFEKSFMYGLTRGNTGHRIDLWTSDGEYYEYFPGDKEMTRDSRYDRAKDNG